MWIRHEQCPQCAERGQDNACDNLGIHEDGHKYCFSCGFYQPKQGVSLADLAREFHTVESQQKEKNDSNSLPFDTHPFIPQKALTWLKKYGITNEEIEENQISFSPSRELLVFPIGSKGQHMEAWQGRYFGSNPEHPKYLTKGYKSNIMHVVNAGETSTVILVEDLISAIKVGRQYAAMPLFGSDITKTQLFRLSRYYENIAIWLDPDKYQHAIKLGQRAELFFKEVHVVFSEKDPKDFSDEEIKGFISGFHTMELG